MSHKTCTRCRKRKRLSAFHRGKLYCGGYNARCRACRSEIAAQAYQATRAARAAAWKKSYYADLEANRRKRLDAYYRHRDALGIKPKPVYATPEARAAAQAANKRRYAERHPLRVVQAKRSYAERYPERVKMVAARNKARRREAGGEVTGQDWKAICLFYGNACAECHTSAADRPLTVDHFIPIVKGGRHDWTNVWPLCLRCNLKKHDKMPSLRQPPHVAVLEKTGTND
jgi:5-methylcytosine-specific restriction endonuclease McrA